MGRKKSVWDKKIVALLAGELEGEESETVRKTIEKVRNLDFKTMLDAGCGVGRFYRFFGKDYDYTGIDRSPAMIEYCKVNYPDRAGNFLIQDIHDLGFPDRNFDLVFSFDVLAHIHNPVFTRCLEELYRVTGKYLVLVSSYNCSIGTYEDRYFLGDYYEYEFPVMFTSHGTYIDILSRYGPSSIDFFDIPVERTICQVPIKYETILVVKR